MPAPIVSLVIVLMGALLGSCAVHAPSSASGGRALSPALEPTEDSARDAQTGLPNRVMHVASGVVLRLVPAGEFDMGEPDGQGPERRHRRIIRRPFYMGEGEVTIAEFRRFVEATGYITDAERGIAEEPDKLIGAFAQTGMLHDRQWDARAQWRNPFPLLDGHVPLDDHPVSQVSWNDAMAYCAHYGLALPTEAQWEYACRGGPSGQPSPPGNLSDAATARRFTRFEGDATRDDGYSTLAPLRTPPANALGLYHMAGNVEEWTAGPFAVREPRDGDDESVSPRMAEGEPVKVLRGAAWFSGPNPTCAARFGMRPFSRRDFIGFRVVAVVPE